MNDTWVTLILGIATLMASMFAAIMSNKNHDKLNKLLGVSPIPAIPAISPPIATPVASQSITGTPYGGIIVINGVTYKPLF